jgi:hypothetical protein
MIQSFKALHLSRKLRPFSTTTELVAVAYPVVVLTLMIFKERDSDFLAHIRMARDATHGTSGSYSVLFPILNLITELSTRQSVVRSMLVLILSAGLILRWHVSVRVLRRSGAQELNARIMCFGLLVFMPLLDPRNLESISFLFKAKTYSDIYLGQITPNVWHNSTTIFMAPFAMLAAYWLPDAVRYSDTRKSALASVALLSSALAKPNYALAAVPAAGLLGLWYLVKDHRNLKKQLTMLIFVIGPTVLIVAYQIAVTTFDSTSVHAGSIAIDPLKQWRYFSDNIPLSIIRSISLPFLITGAVSVLKRSLSPELFFAWATFLLSLFIFALFIETNRDGSYDLAGNLSWGLFPSLYILLLFSIRDWCACYYSMKYLRTVRTTNALIWVLFALHAATGLVYGVLVAGGTIEYL